MPAQERPRANHEGAPPLPWEHPRERRENGAVAAGQPGPRLGPAENLQLMAQDEDLELVGPVRAVQPQEPAERSRDEVDEEGHRRMVDEREVRLGDRVLAPDSPPPALGPYEHDFTRPYDPHPILRRGR